MNEKNLTDDSSVLNAQEPLKHPRLARMLGMFEKLQDVSDELDELPPRRQRDRLLGQKRRHRSELLQLFENNPPQTLLDRASQPGRLSAEDLALLGRLFYQRLSTEDYFLTGRDLLWFLADSSYELFEKMSLLQPGSALMQSGLVLAFNEGEDDPRDLLNRVYTLAPEVYRRMTRPDEEPRELNDARRPFADGVEHFLEMTALVKLAELRAARVFADGYWRELHGEPVESARELEHRIELALQGIESRLAASREIDRFPLHLIQIDHGLNEAELVMVTALAAQEALMGLPSLDVIDLLRLVSRSQRDLLRRRSLLSPQSRLIQSGILMLEEGGEKSSLTGEVALAPWVLDRLIGGPMTGDLRIGSDERIDFHDFLSRLDGSDDFFDQL